VLRHCTTEWVWGKVRNKNKEERNKEVRRETRGRSARESEKEKDELLIRMNMYRDPQRINSELFWVVSFFKLNSIFSKFSFVIVIEFHLCKN